ncbi:unnamed protein product [Paramecium sonneborni]|uniref:CSD domain-containing protein n=1 Tax=Paramecium sonneborni TaxID=65129 RepID=A0A8S1R2M6_9CILI|nr:unnamed protein product [Paramecium sonneborni]
MEEDLKKLTQIEQIVEKNKKLLEFISSLQFYDIQLFYAVKMIDINLKIAFQNLEKAVILFQNTSAILYSRITKQIRINSKSVRSQIKFAYNFWWSEQLFRFTIKKLIFILIEFSYMIIMYNQEKLFYYWLSRGDLFNQQRIQFFNNQEFQSIIFQNNYFSQVFRSMVYPTESWDFLQEFESVNEWQEFFDSHFLRYLKIEIIDFHQAEYHCTLTQLRIFRQTFIGDLIQFHSRYQLQLPKIELIKEVMKQPKRIKNLCNQIMNKYGNSNKSTHSYLDYIFDLSQSSQMNSKIQINICNSFRIQSIIIQGGCIKHSYFISQAFIIKVIKGIIIIYFQNQVEKEKQNQKYIDYINNYYQNSNNSQLNSYTNFVYQSYLFFMLDSNYQIMLNQEQQKLIDINSKQKEYSRYYFCVSNFCEWQQKINDKNGHHVNKKQMIIIRKRGIFQNIQFIKQLMFPSKLYDLQLTPSLNKFNSDYESAKLIESFKQLLIEDDKEIVTSAMDLMKAISYSLYGTWYYWKVLNEICRGDDLNTISQQLQRKIIIYDICEIEDLKCQVINFGYKKRIYLARYLNYFYVVDKKGTSEKHKLVKDILMDVINEIIGLPIRRHKRSYSDAFKYLSDQKDNRTNKVNIKNVPLSPSNISRTSLQMQLLDEINQESDLLLKECDSLINSPSPQNDLLQSLNLNLQEGTNILSNIRYFGTLKFYDEARSYGFIIMDMDGSDLFVHSDDLTKAGMSKDFLRTAKHGNIIRFSFLILEYFGKYNKSRKAVDLQFIQGQPYFM